MNSKSYFPKALSIIFIFQFIIFAIISYSKKDITFIYWAILLILPLGILLYFGYLSVDLDDKRIKYSMPPFVINKKLKWDEIEKYEIINISPLNDFLGWGIRHSSKYGWSYILETNYAMVIFKKDGKKLTLSIDDREKILSYLHSINK